MKKYLLAVGFFLTSCLLIPASSYAQFTTVTATVKDANGIPYAGAILNAVLVPGASGGYTLSGAPYAGRIGPVTLDSSGKFTVNFGDVTLITPGSPQWQITIDSAGATIPLPLGTGPQTFTFTSTGTTISGSSPVSLTASLNALAPTLTNFSTASSGLQFVSSLPATCTPGTTLAVELSTAPFFGYYCGATNGWLPFGNTSYGTVTSAGTAQAQTVSTQPPLTSTGLVPLVQICWAPVAANTGAAPTLAGSGSSTFPATVIKKGISGATALVANDIVPTVVACAIYDGTQFELQNPQNIAVSSVASTGPVNVGSSPPSACGSATGCIALTEASTAGTPTAGQAYIRSDSPTHTFKCSNNLSADGGCTLFGLTSVTSNGCFNVNSISGGTSTVQAAITAAGVNGLTCVPTTDAGVDIPNGTRMANVNSPAITAQPNGASVQDYRFGEFATSFYNPQFDNQNNVWNASQKFCTWNENIGHQAAPPGTGANNSVCNMIGSYWLFGTQNINQNGTTNKSNLVGDFKFCAAWTPGQDECDTSEVINYSTGDTTIGFDSAVSFGGQVAGSDEGLEWRDAALSTGYVEYQCALTAGVSVGATNVPCGSATQGSGTQSADRTLYDVTKVYTTGTVTVGGQTSFVTITGTGTNWTTAPLPAAASTTTTTSAAISVPATTTTSAAITTTGSQSVQVGTSTGLSVNAQVSVNDVTPGNFETVTITAIADSTHFTANFTKTHLTGATVTQNEPGAINIQVGNSTGFATNNVLCVADTTTFEYVTATAVPDGTHITGYFHLPHASGATIATGGLCGYGIEFTDDDWTTPGAIGYFTVTGTLRQVWPVVSNSSATSLIIQVTVAGNGDVYGGTNNTGAYRLYPIAHTWQGTNGQSNTLTTEPVAVAFANADSMSMATGPTFKHTGLGNWSFNNFFPSQSLGGWATSLTYNGIVSGNDYGWGITNNTALTKYSGHSGHLSVPQEFLLFKGLYQNGIVFNAAPDTAALNVQCPINASGVVSCATGNITVIGVSDQQNPTSVIDYLRYIPATGSNYWRLQFQNNNHACTFGQTANGISCDGYVTAGGFQSASNCSSSASPAVCASAAAGSVVIAAAATTVTVNTTAVTNVSQIFLTADDTLGTKLGVTCNSTLATLIGGLAVTARSGGTSFQITSGATPAVNPLCISYFIVN